MRYPMKEFLHGDERVLRWIINELYLEVYVRCKDEGYRLVAISSLSHHVRVDDWLLKCASGYSYQDLGLPGGEGRHWWQSISGVEIDRRSARTKPDVLILPWNGLCRRMGARPTALLPDINAADYWI